MDVEQVPDYDRQNREERALCSHLFRLLLNSQHGDPDACFFRAFLKLFAQGELSDHQAITRLQTLNATEVRNARVYSEVTVVRDLLASNKGFRDELQRFCRNQRAVKDGWEERQILCTKPDMAIVAGGVLLVIEAKFTQGFDPSQLDRTESLVSAWKWMKTPMHFLGIADDAFSCVARLGGRATDPHASWESVYDAAKATPTFKPDDPSVQALAWAQNHLPLKADVDDVENMGDVITLKGLAALAEHAYAYPGGYVGFAGGITALYAKLDDIDYLINRPYKWLPKLEPGGRHIAKNWLGVERFLATMTGLLAKPCDDN